LALHCQGRFFLPDPCKRGRRSENTLRFALPQKHAHSTHAIEKGAQESRVSSADWACPVRGQPVLDACAAPGVSSMEAVAASQHPHILACDEALQADATHFASVVARGSAHAGCRHNSSIAQAPPRATCVRVVRVLQGTGAAAPQVHGLVARQRGDAAEGHAPAVRSSPRAAAPPSVWAAEERQVGVLAHQLVPLRVRLGLCGGVFRNRGERGDAEHCTEGECVDREDWSQATKRDMLRCVHANFCNAAPGKRAHARACPPCKGAVMHRLKRSN
jgi:hypothetical protein